PRRSQSGSSASSPESPTRRAWRCTSRRLEGVPEEEVVAVQPGGAEGAAAFLLGQQRHALDDPEPLVSRRPAGEERREGEEELVDELCRDERAEEPRAGLAEDAPVAALPQEGHRGGDIDGVLTRYDRDLRLVRQEAGETVGRELGREHECPLAQDRMPG